MELPLINLFYLRLIFIYLFVVLLFSQSAVNFKTSLSLCLSVSVFLCLPVSVCQSLSDCLSVCLTLSLSRYRYRYINLRKDQEKLFKGRVYAISFCYFHDLPDFWWKTLSFRKFSTSMWWDLVYTSKYSNPFSVFPQNGFTFHPVLQVFFLLDSGM